MSGVKPPLLALSAAAPAPSSSSTHSWLPRRAADSSGVSLRGRGAGCRRHSEAGAQADVRQPRTPCPAALRNGPHHPAAGPLPAAKAHEGRTGCSCGHRVPGGRQLVQECACCASEGHHSPCTSNGRPPQQQAAQRDNSAGCRQRIRRVSPGIVRRIHLLQPRRLQQRTQHACHAVVSCPVHCAPPTQPAARCCPRCQQLLGAAAVAAGKGCQQGPDALGVGRIWVRPASQQRLNNMRMACLCSKQKAAEAAAGWALSLEKDFTGAPGRRPRLAVCTAGGPNAARGRNAAKCAARRVAAGRDMRRKPAGKQAIWQAGASYASARPG